MSSKRFPRARAAFWAVLVAAAILVPAAAPGDVIRLKDGSTLKGRLTRVDGDTLTVRLSIGAPVKILRSQVESIVFSDSIAAPPPSTGAPIVAAPAPQKGSGRIVVKFEDREVSSKITVDKKKDWDAKVRSNDIVVEFVVDGVVAYSAIDSVTDKTIYMGHEKQLKNDAELADFEVQVAAGPHNCKLVIRNRDPDTFRDFFDPDPLNAVLEVDEVVTAGGVARVDVRIDKGLLRVSSPKLYKSGGEN